jgi:hypothetical protein
VHRSAFAGWERPLTQAQLDAHYPRHRDDVQQVRASVEKLVAARIITPYDGRRILKEAQQANVP